MMDPAALSLLNSSQHQRAPVLRERQVNQFFPENLTGLQPAIFSPASLRRVTFPSLSRATTRTLAV